MKKPKIFLFDLDGTLLDSAPDLAGAANLMRKARGLEPLPYENLRKVASAGARGLLGAAFGITPEDAVYKDMAREFLDTYEAHLFERTHLFDGIGQMLRTIEDEGFRWGIVTNKHARFTLPLLEHLKLKPQALVCGDTLGIAKPDPRPLLFALKTIAGTPDEAVYAGDDIRDIQAANSAGIHSIACRWGYLGCTEGIENWEADTIVRNPRQIPLIELP